VENAIKYPGYSRQLEDYSRQKTDLTNQLQQQQGGVADQQAQANLQGTQARTSLEQKQAATYGQSNAAQLVEKGGQVEDNGIHLTSPEGHHGSHFQTSDGRTVYMPTQEEQTAMKQRLSTTNWPTVTAEIAASDIGQKMGLTEGDKIDPKIFNGLRATVGQQPKTPKIASKDTFQATVSKLAAAGELPPDAATSVRSLTNALMKSPTLSQQEKSDAIGYVTTNPTPASTTTAGAIRMTVMGQNREYPVINKQTGQLEMRSSADINGSPGMFAPAGPGAAALSKGAIFQDLHYNIDSTRKAIGALETMDPGTRAALSYALRGTDPKSSIQTFLTGAVGTNMNPQQQEAVMSLALLAENAMSLRSVAGMGQGSDELRAAIMNTLPSGKSPTKGYALKQLEKFESVVSRLESGVPGMQAPGQAGQKKVGSTSTSAPTGGPKLGDTQQHNGDTYKFDGQVWKKQ